MSLSCGLVGLAGSGKTTIYNGVTAAGAAYFDGAEMHSATVDVPDSRLDELAALYHPKKIIPATLNIVDIPGLKTGDAERTGRGNRLLAHVKDVDLLLHVVRCFDPAGEKIDSASDVETLDLELMVADSQTLANKIERLVKKVRAGEAEAVRQTADCEKVKAGLEEGIPARRQDLSARQNESVEECNLVSLKPVLYVANIASMDDVESAPVRALEALAAAEGAEIITVCGRDEDDISRLDPSEREEFMLGLGIAESSMTRLLGAAYRKLGLVTFFTVGPDEVRAWTCRCGDKAPVAAGKIHTDMEHGFIRMEVMRCEGLLELGSEAAVVKAGKQRLEGKTYEVQEGDVVVVRFSKS